MLDFVNEFWKTYTVDKFQKIGYFFDKFHNKMCLFFLNFEQTHDFIDTFWKTW